MAFLGMRGSGDFGPNERPENWRQTILLFFPNGETALTGITSMVSSEETDDPHFHWFTKTLAKQAGDVTNVFLDQALSSAVLAATNSTTGDTVYVQAAESVISEFRVGHVAKLRKKDDYRHDTVGEVTERSLAGANSFIAVKLIEDASVTYGLDEVNYVLIVGDANAEGSEMPDGIGYDPDEFDGLTQIFRTPLSITRTARKTRYRTGNKYEEEKREALLYHGIGMEQALIHGVQYSTTGINGKPKRFAGGAIEFIKTNANENVSDFSLDPDFDATTWLNGGSDWIDKQLEKIFRFGAREKLALVGSTTIRAINQLAKFDGNIQLQTAQEDFGLQVTKWLTPYGMLNLMLHPLFSHEPTDRRSMLILEPKNITPRILDDTMFIEDPQDRKNRNHSKDATEEEYLTEMGWEFHEPMSMGYLNGFGLDNPA